MTTFQSPLDIGNRCCNHLGARSITSFADGSREANKIAEVYDKIRQAELRRNYWIFATRKAALRPIDTTTMLLVPVGWISTTTYKTGDIVLYSSEIFIALQDMITANIPPIDVNGEVSNYWDNYYGPMTVDTWVATSSTANTLPSPSAYNAGELVYITPGDGNAYTFLSLVDANSDDPLTPVDWDEDTQYVLGQIVLGSNSTLYQSAGNFNIGNDPSIVFGLAAWSSGTTYALGAYVYYTTDNQVYKSLAASNTGNNPVTATTKWLATGMWNGLWSTTISTPQASSSKWHYVNCNLQPLGIVFPVSTAPLSTPQTKNLYHLPNNFLMRAPREEDLGNQFSWLGAHNPPSEDFIFQGQYIISANVSPIILRFISDFQNVTLMDAMFCEGLAARMGWELCEVITQKPDLKAACLLAYDKHISEARTINAIEIGPIEQEEDELISIRY